MRRRLTRCRIRCQDGPHRGGFWRSRYLPSRCSMSWQWANTSCRFRLPSRGREWHDHQEPCRWRAGRLPTCIERNLRRQWKLLRLGHSCRFQLGFELRRVSLSSWTFRNVCRPWTQLCMLDWCTCSGIWGFRLHRCMAFLFRWRDVRMGRSGMAGNLGLIRKFLRSQYPCGPNKTKPSRGILRCIRSHKCDSSSRDALMTNELEWCRWNGCMYDRSSPRQRQMPE